MRRKGDGWEVPNKTNKTTGKKESGDMIYVLGTIDGKFYRRSSGKKVNATNIAWIKKNARDVLLKLIAKEEINKQPIRQNDLESFGMMVLETTARGRRSANSQKCKIGNFKNHILPYFENYSLNDIKTTDVEVWQNKLLEKYSTSTVKKCRDILSLIFKKAQADDLVNKNYVEFADNVAVKSKKKEPYTKEELRLLVEHSDGWFKLYLILVFSTGLRIGEAIGLQWEDIDLNNGYIDLKRSISKGVIVDATDETNKTKNHQRIIPLDNTLKKELSNYHMNRPDDTWLFVNKYGNHFGDSKTLNRYYWKPLLAKLDIEDRTMYATRHTFVTLMKNNGADTAWLKSVIGHKQSSTVLDDVYFTHKSSQQDIKLANNFFHMLETNNEMVCENA